MIVTGPSLIRDTFMSAPNTPVSTRAPRSRRACTTAPTRGSATGPGTAAFGQVRVERELADHQQRRGNVGAGLLAVEDAQPPEQAARLAAKLWGLRILDGEKSCSDTGAPLLVISQFTLYADLAKGRRPSWSAAAPGPVAEPLVGTVVRALRDLGARVETGVFGADMKVSLVNDGPVTIIVDL